MGSLSVISHKFIAALRAALLALMVCAGVMRCQTRATSVPLLLPTNIAIDAQGNLYIAETGRHIVRRVDVQGVITTVAGSGVQGFDGDGGQATSALLDSPLGLALGTGSLYIADSHNHRVRKVDLTTGVISTIAGGAARGSSGDGGKAVDATLDQPSALAFDRAGNLFIADSGRNCIRRIASDGIITTVAGSGVQGIAGDDSLATAALFDSPGGLAVDASGNIYLADTHNHRVRRIDAASGKVTTIAGNGIGSFSGDGRAAIRASLDLPRGLSLDQQGNLYIADASNQRVRRIDATSGAITTVVGNGVQGHDGDHGAPTSASLNGPSGVIVAEGGAVNVVDSGNARVRQVDSMNSLQTVAGLGTTSPGILMISGASATSYGSGQLLATLNNTSVSGSVTFFDISSGSMRTLATVAIQAGQAVLDLSALDAGQYRIVASYSGDQTHAATQSAVYPITISPIAVTVTTIPSTVEYGATIPALQAGITGLLTRDQGKVTAVLSIPSPVTTVGVYPISVILTGMSASNYTVAAMPMLSVVPAQTSISLTSGSTMVSVGQAVTLTAQVVSSTGAIPVGEVSFKDGGASLGSGMVDVQGQFALTTASLSPGVHTLTAAYSGSANFRSSTSSPSTLTIGETQGGSADFSMSTAGATVQTVAAGESAAFTFNVRPQEGLTSQIAFAASGLPGATTATFSPSYIPPGASSTTVTLTIAALKSARKENVGRSAVLAGLVLCLGLRRRRYFGGLVMMSLFVVTGCGDRIANSAATTPPSKTYTITVTGTATGTDGTAVQHTATFTLVVVPSS